MLGSEKNKIDGIKKVKRRQKSVNSESPYFRHNILSRERLIQFRLGLVLPMAWKKNYSLFLAGALIFLISVLGVAEYHRATELKKGILGTATAGFDYLNSGKTDFFNQDLEGALENFQSASEALAETRRNIESVGGFLGSLLNILPQGGDVENLLRSAEEINTSFNFLIEGIAEFEGARLDWDIASNSSGREFFQKIKLSRLKFVESENALSRALSGLEQVNFNILPESYRGQLVSAGSELYAARAALGNLTTIQTMVLQLFGGEEKTYLLLFMNNNELRPTGGFIGTYGLLTFSNGQARLDRIESIYHLDGQLKTRIAAPGPLQRLVTREWGMRDSNWFADFTVNSRKALEFLETEANILAEGVIAVTPDFFERLLELTGPIAMNEYGEVLTSKNFREITQYKTSIDYDRVENQPKKFLSDFAPKLLSGFRGFETAQWLGTLDLISEMIEQKQMLLFSLDPDIQQTIERFGAGGRIKKTNGDYLAVFHSNVGGGKTDQGIEQSIVKNVFISESGSAIVSLKIERLHNAYQEKYFPKNVDFMRILVPAGSKLLTASGFDPIGMPKYELPDALSDPEAAVWHESMSWRQDLSVFEGAESGYTFFAGWLELDPGQSRQIELVYKLPSQIDTTYTHLFQQQPGARESDFSLNVEYPKQIVYVYPENIELSDGTVSLDKKVRSDDFFAIIGE